LVGYDSFWELARNEVPEIAEAVAADLKLEYPLKRGVNPTAEFELAD
jgi:hypothetical protein